ncbi:hypothetical protein J1N35_025365, partial [Gossypium stocksii]
SEHSQRREANVPVEVNYYAYTTKYGQISHHLAIRGIQISKFAYSFFVVEGSRRLSDTKG